MKNFCRMTIVTTAAALCATVLLAQAPAPAQTADDEKAKAARAAARARANAQNFEQNARVLTIFDRDGKTVAEVGERAIYNQPVFSPDRTRVAVIKSDLEAETSDLWVIDVATGKSTRITTSKSREPVQAPVWSPD